MNNTSTRTPKISLVRLIRRRLLVAAILLVFAFLFNFLAGIYIFDRQYNLGEQKVVLQQDQNGILIAMLNQETGLRGYLLTTSPAFLVPLNNGRPQYLLLVQQLKGQAKGTQAGDFNRTITALAQVVARANDWYSHYAQIQIKRVQSGNLAVARSIGIVSVGKGLFDRFRASVAQLQQAVVDDINTIELQVTMFNQIVLSSALVLSVIALSIVGYTFITFVKGLLEDLTILQTRSNQLGSGDLSARVQELTYQELSSLGQTFNVMAEDLATRSRDLEGSNKELATRSRDLERSNAAMSQLAAIVESSGEAMLSKTLQGNILSWNSGAEHLYGYTADEMIGKSISLLIPPDRQAELQELLARITAGETVQRFETLRLRKDGTPVQVSLTVSPIRDPKGKVIAASTISHDISEQKRMVEELMALNSALEEANRARSQFLATMSHELRTPLTSIIGFSQMMLDDADSANLNQEQHNDVERILKNGLHLLGLINDVLDLTKIEAGRMVVSYSEVDVRELLTSVVDETQSIASARHLVLRAEVDKGMDFLESNPLKLRQIVLNLVSNALKFTEQGEVIISARRVTSSDQEGECMSLAVKDSGIGIPVAIQEHIFEAFYQADGTYTRKAGGTGLGLSIVNELTMLLGGTLAVTSAKGQGSTFTVLLPINAVHHFVEQDPPRLKIAQPLEHSAIPPTSGDLSPAISDEAVAVSAQQGDTEEQNHLILAVDDNLDGIDLVKAALKDTSYSVIGLQDSSKAMELVQELHPCAILLDVMMPDVNGWQLLHQLKENPATVSIPVIMITVLTEQTTSYVLGADAYLMKPFQAADLLDTLRNLLALQKGRTQADEREAQWV